MGVSPSRPINGSMGRAKARQVKRTATVSASEIADLIRPLLPLAKKAYGSQAPDSDPRKASEEINAYILFYVERGGRIPELAQHLEGDISLSGLRRRVRIARGADTSAYEGQEQVVGRVSRPRGKKDPESVSEAVRSIQEARKQGGRVYGDAVRRAYDDGISLKAIADQIGISYYSLWSAKRTSW